MPTITKKLLEDSVAHTTRMGEYIKDCNYAIELAGHLELSESTRVNPYGSSIWFNTTNREDVEKLMTLAPVGKHWSKRDENAQIVYSVSLDDGKEICIYAMDGALPPTCETVEIEEIVPAQPATTRKKFVIRCKPAGVSEQPVETPEAVAKEQEDEENV